MKKISRKKDSYRFFRSKLDQLIQRDFLDRFGTIEN